jgi:hypothetical protein
MQSPSFKNSTIAWRRTPSHPYHPINRKRIRRSSTPDVLQTSLSIYQFKSALSRKSAPPCLHIVPASLGRSEVTVYNFLPFFLFLLNVWVWRLRILILKELDQIQEKQRLGLGAICWEHSFKSRVWAYIPSGPFAIDASKLLKQVVTSSEVIVISDNVSSVFVWKQVLTASSSVQY